MKTPAKTVFICVLWLSGMGLTQPPLQEKGKELKLWFRQPASQWNEALPVGNGHLGAMVFGGVPTERLQLNEETVWSGSDVDTHNPKSIETLDRVRKLLFAGQYVAAEKLAQQGIMGQRPNPRATYQTLGDLTLEFSEQNNIRDYTRELDLRTAIAKVTYRANRDTWYTREVFSSAVDRALVVRLTASRPESLSLTVNLTRPGNKASITVEGQTITLSEHVGNGVGVRLFSLVQVQNQGGTVTASEQSLQINQADEVILQLTAATDYWGQNPEAIARQRLDQADVRSYEDMQRDHIADYQQYFNRVDLDLGVTESVYFPTDARVAAMQAGNVDPHLFQLYYQFGRYLLISSSRPGGLPANLQGIWADGLTPPWSADYHININIQMNYWPAEVTNLSELHEPFLRFLDALRADGRKTAKQVYDCNGIVAHYTTDAWHFTEPEGHINYAMWPMGLTWSCQHLWEHYAFTGDEIFLRDQAYPILKETAEFCLDWLVPNPQTGYLVSGPSISPENRFVTPKGVASMVMGPTMDHMIIRDLLQHCIAASDILECDEALSQQWQDTLNRLAPIQVGSDGRLMEWTEEFEEENPGHRHISHLFGLHPSDQITYQKQPELLAAARKTIDYRLAHGGGHTGWSRAWIINFFARLWDGEKAYENLLALLRKSTLSNLFDTHPPFQIDGNFGATAGISEMLLQSHAGEVHLLPALPQAWNQGHVHGLCARGGFEVDIDWSQGRLIQAVIRSRLAQTCRIRYRDKVIILPTETGKSYRINGDLVLD